MQKCHDKLFFIILSDKKTEIAKKAKVNINPLIKVAHEIFPDKLGTNAPITSEPNIIFEPSRKKFEIIFNFSGEIILFTY